MQILYIFAKFTIAKPLDKSLFPRFMNSKFLFKIPWMDQETKKRAHIKLSSIKEYIAYPDEIMVDKNLEELYDGLSINSTHYFLNGISMSIWSTNYHWKKLREEV